jgi:putative transposase
MLVMQAYRYAHLTPAWQRLVAVHVDAARFVCHRASARVKVVLDQRAAERKTCSAWGIAKTKPALSEREYCCGVCGVVLNRAHNAALNLAALAAECDTAGSGPVAARGADRKTRVRGRVTVKREPGTAFQRVRPGPSYRKVGLPTVCTPKHTER